jgi:hypothetical protein
VVVEAMAAAARETSLANSRGVSWAVGNNMAVLLADTLVAAAVPATLLDSLLVVC